MSEYGEDSPSVARTLQAKLESFGHIRDPQTFDEMLNELHGWVSRHAGRPAMLEALREHVRAIRGPISSRDYAQLRLFDASGDVVPAPQVSLRTVAALRIEGQLIGLTRGRPEDVLGGPEESRVGLADRSAMVDLSRQLVQGWAVRNSQADFHDDVALFLLLAGRKDLADPFFVGPFEDPADNDAYFEMYAYMGIGLRFRAAEKITGRAQASGNPQMWELAAWRWLDVRCTRPAQDAISAMRELNHAPKRVDRVMDRLIEVGVYEHAEDRRRMLTDDVEGLGDRSTDHPADAVRLCMRRGMYDEAMRRARAMTNATAAVVKASAFEFVAEVCELTREPEQIVQYCTFARSIDNRPMTDIHARALRELGRLDQLFEEISSDLGNGHEETLWMARHLLPADFEPAMRRLHFERQLLTADALSQVHSMARQARDSGYETGALLLQAGRRARHWEHADRWGLIIDEADLWVRDGQVDRIPILSAEAWRPGMVPAGRMLPGYQMQALHNLSSGLRNHPDRAGRMAGARLYAAAAMDFGDPNTMDRAATFYEAVDRGDPTDETRMGAMTLRRLAGECRNPRRSVLPFDIRGDRGPRRLMRPQGDDRGRGDGLSGPSLPPPGL